MQRQKEQMEAATAGTGVTVSQTADNRLMLDIPSDISFDTNRYAIKPDFRAVLDQFARGLQENAATRVTIIGHTDSTGSDAINNPLSINRAASTRDYLAARGVSMNRISIDGRGSREPVASNDTAEGRARNRHEHYGKPQDHGARRAPSVALRSPEDRHARGRERQGHEADLLPRRNDRLVGLHRSARHGWAWTST